MRAPKSGPKVRAHPVLAVPTLNLAPRDVEGLLDELEAYHALFSPLFARTEQRHWAKKYLEGQLLDIPRKSMEPRVLALEGPNPAAVRAMQQFIGEGAWDDDPLLVQHQRLVDETLGAANGVLIVDPSGFPKQGRDSVGVARQYCGALGKVANCQVGVFLGYASAAGYTLVDRRLYLPKPWFAPEARDRWERCGIPDGTRFQTAPQLAAQMLRQVVERGTLRFQWVTCDEQFGRDPAFLDEIAQLHKWYFAEVPQDTRVWRRRPATRVPPAKDRGRRPTRPRLRPGAPAAPRVDVVAQTLPRRAWTRRTIKEGAKGPIVAEFAFVRAVAVRKGLPGPPIWVVFRRSLGPTPELKVYLSNAPKHLSKRELVRVSGMRWPVETAIQESKGELGMDHYETRSWRGWHHHMTMTLLAHHFLVRVRLRLKKKPSVDGPPSPRVAQRSLAQERVRCPRRPGSNPVLPAPQPYRLSRPSQAHAQTPAPAAFVEAR